MNQEVALISSVCKEKDAGILFADIDELFTTHHDVWQSLKDYYSIHKAIPSAEVLKEDFKYFTPVKTPGATQHYLDKLREEWLRHQLNGMFVELNGDIKQGRASTEVLDRAMRRVADLHKTTSPVRDIDITDFEPAKEDYAARKKLADERGGSPGISLGIKRIDDGYPTGFAPGHFIVFIGWSGHGKSWFSTLAACKAWEAGYKPMIISLEMSPETVRDRIYTVMASGALKNTDLVRGAVDIDHFEHWASGAMQDKREFVVVATDSVDSVRPATIQSKIDQHKPDIIFLDYAQLFDDNRQSEHMTTRMMNVSREFKLMAVQNNIPVVLLTQATMESKSDVNSPPMIEQVAWSKSIQNDADLALAVHKYTDTNRFEIVARKNRHGPDFALDLEWDLNTGVYEEIEAQVFEEWDENADDNTFEQAITALSALNGGQHEK